MNQDDLIAALDELLKQPFQHRTATHARQVWKIYSQINIDAVRSLPRSTLRRVLFAIVSPQAAAFLPIETHRANRVTKHAVTAEQWDFRLSRLISHMRLAEGSDDMVEWRAFDYAMKMLAKVGAVRQVEQIVQEVERRPGFGKPQTMLKHRLTALSKQLRDLASIPRPKGQWTAEPGEDCKEALSAILRDYQHERIDFDAITTRLISVCLGLLQSLTIEEGMAEVFDRLLEEIFEKMYKLDMTTLIIGDKPSAYFNYESVNTLLGYLGRKGELWRMVSAFETFSSPQQEEADVPAVEEVGNDAPASLRSQMAQVPKNILSSFRGLDWGALRLVRQVDVDMVAHPAPETATSSTRPKRTYDDFFPSGPTPFDIAADYNSTPLTYVKTPSLSSQGKSIRQIIPSASHDPVLVTNLMYQTMLRHAVHRADVDVAMYVVRSLHKASVQAQGQWISHVLARQRVTAHSPVDAIVDSDSGLTLLEKETSPSFQTDEDEETDEVEEDHLDVEEAPASAGKASVTALQTRIRTDQGRSELSEWYTDLRRPRVHASFWPADLLWWMLRKRQGRGNIYRFRAVRATLRDMVRRLRQEKVVLFGREHGASEPSDSGEDVPAIELPAPPFAGIKPRRRRLPELSLHSAFDPAEYLHIINETHSRLEGLLELSESQALVRWRASQRRSKKSNERKEVSGARDNPRLAAPLEPGKADVGEEWPRKDGRPS